MRRILLFAYGTLLDRRVQRRVFGRTPATVAARLENWTVRRRAVRGRYPGIAPARGRMTLGRVLDLATGELRRADTYEDAPHLYRRRRVRVRLAGGTAPCWVYVPTVRAVPELPEAANRR